jgi:hypothetical protein
MALKLSISNVFIRLKISLSVRLSVCVSAFHFICLSIALTIQA